MIPLGVCSLVYLALIVYATVGVRKLGRLELSAQIADDQLEHWSAPYRTAILWLNRLAGVATLLGLFGTVTGIQTAFADMELAQNISPDTFARGINQALITTVAGLAMAIPGTVLHFVFRDLFERGSKLALRRAASDRGES